MSFNNIVSEKFILPLSDLLLGFSINKDLKFLMKSQWWSKKQIDDYQNKKLRELIHHAYTNVPYYKEMFDKIGLKPEDIKTKEDLHKIPITTKSDLKKHKDKHVAVNISPKNLMFRSSSGSTGEPFQFYTTKKAESFSKATTIRGWYWMGYKLGDKYVKLSMNPRSSKIKKLQDKINNCLYLSVNQLSPKEIVKIGKAISNFNPKFIRGYPVPLYSLAKAIKDVGGYSKSSLRGINTTGSSLRENVRDEIESVFQSKIYDAYSCEGGSCFHQCSASKFYHPAEEYAISEFIEDDFSKSNNEYPLRHITTDLHNFASPFIRYDTQDYIILEDKDRCECGRSFINVKKILGRDGDILITPSGKYLIVENFVAYFEWIVGIDQIQVIQEKINKITINIIINNDFTKTIFNTVQDYWKTYIGNDVEVNLKIVDDIRLTPTGKRRTVIRNADIKLYDN